MRRNRAYGRGGYSHYRGRSPFSTLLKVIALLLAVLLVLAVAALFFLEPYWVYSADGGRLYLPWVQEPEETPVQTLPTPSQPLVVITPEPVAEDPLHAVLLPRSALSDGTAQALVDQAGGSAALFDMKADDGTLAFVSASPLAVSAGVNAAAGANEAIAALNAQEGLYTVARLSCFRDNTLPRQRNDLALRSSLGNWRDEDNIRWLSPAYQENRQYISDLCLELAGLGFDEILLDYAAFPLTGNLDAILTGAAYEPTTLADVVLTFYTDTAAALKAAYPDVRLSVVADPAILTAGGTSTSGQSLDIVTLADRLWVWGLTGDRDACEALLSQAGMETPTTGLVSISTQTGADGQSWALWT